MSVQYASASSSHASVLHLRWNDSNLSIHLSPLLIMAAIHDGCPAHRLALPLAELHCLCHEAGVCSLPRRALRLLMYPFWAGEKAMSFSALCFAMRCIPSYFWTLSFKFYLYVLFSLFFIAFYAIPMLCFWFLFDSLFLFCHSAFFQIFLVVTCLSNNVDSCKKIIQNLNTKLILFGVWILRIWKSTFSRPLAKASLDQRLLDGHRSPVQI